MMDRCNKFYLFSNIKQCSKILFSRIGCSAFVLGKAFEFRSKYYCVVNIRRSEIGLESWLAAPCDKPGDMLQQLGGTNKRANP